ncbi:MAG: cytochrome C oxidase subunit IV [Chloroflexota bacterium]|nr:MAG: cytochrome C oxidase subunit IV [Chloroflexota bacterium]
MASEHRAAHGTGDAAHAHPTARQYIVIAIVLTIITAVEVGIYYVPYLAPVLMPLLAILAAAKFILVAAYYMHLKFDAPVLTWFFVAGLVIATAIIGGLWALFNGWGG